MTGTKSNGGQTRTPRTTIFPNLKRSLAALKRMASAYRKQGEQGFISTAKMLAELTAERLRGS